MRVNGLQHGIYSTPEWLSEESKQLLSQLLQVEPKRRITIPDLLQHTWLTKGFNVPIEWQSKYKVSWKTLFVDGWVN